MSLRKHMIEEAYEAVQAIEDGDDLALVDELGDLLLQIVFHAQMASEAGSFGIDDVTDAIVEKLRRRHPHIFGTVSVSGSEDVIQNWDAIKRDESEGKATLSGVPRGLPSLMRAQKMSRKAAGTGFDWETVDDVWVKVHEEIQELREASQDLEHATEEVGDLLFTVVNVARKLGVDAETALHQACDKFQTRFGHMEDASAESGLSLSDLNIDEFERLWKDAKLLEDHQHHSAGDPGLEGQPHDRGRCTDRLWFTGKSSRAVRGFDGRVRGGGVA